ncbi:MAG TPA: type II CAAX endopeptidase family protein [Gaiellaceae bacterium]|nr:type II CAAX endopeptidase family protein [Gaiellaceae bacterium]
MEADRDAVGREGWRIAAWASLVVFLSVLAYGSRLDGGGPPDDALYRYETAVGGIVVYGVLLLLLLWIGRGLPKRELFALRRPPSWPGALGLALAAYVAIFLGAGLILIALDAQDEQGLTPEAWDSSRAGAYAANFLAVALVGPVVEELMYRGAGMTLLARFGLPVSVLVTSVGFGLGHGLVFALPALVFFGLVTAALRVRTTSVYPCILVHCAFNATSLIVSVAA